MISTCTVVGGGAALQKASCIEEINLFSKNSGEYKDACACTAPRPGYTHHMHPILLLFVAFLAAACLPARTGAAAGNNPSSFCDSAAAQARAACIPHSFVEAIYLPKNVLPTSKFWCPDEKGTANPQICTFVTVSSSSSSSSSRPLASCIMVWNASTIWNRCNPLLSGPPAPENMTGIKHCCPSWSSPNVTTEGAFASSKFGDFRDGNKSSSSSSSSSLPVHFQRGNLAIVMPAGTEAGTVLVLDLVDVPAHFTFAPIEFALSYTFALILQRKPRLYSSGAAMNVSIRVAEIDWNARTSSSAVKSCLRRNNESVAARIFYLDVKQGMWLPLPAARQAYTVPSNGMHIAEATNVPIQLLEEQVCSVPPPLENNACTVFHGASAWEHASFFCLCRGGSCTSQPWWFRSSARTTCRMLLERQFQVTTTDPAL